MPPTAFRHPGAGIADAVVGEHRAGISEETAPDGERPGAVPPPPPTRPAPTEPLSTRLRALTEDR